MKKALLMRPCFFFFQAEDGIRDRDVTGVQTCALPIYSRPVGRLDEAGVAAAGRSCAQARRAARAGGQGEQATPAAGLERVVVAELPVVPVDPVDDLDQATLPGGVPVDKVHLPADQPAAPVG